MMKKIYLTSILAMGMLSVSTNVSAQLKVSDTGKVSIGGLNPKSNCTLTFGNPSGYNTARYVMLSYDSYYGTKDHYGFFNLFYDDSSVPKSFGLYSSVGGNSTKKIGVIGELFSTNTGNGIGVYGYSSGAPSNLCNVAFTGNYAGYFSGAVKVDGTLTATKLVSTSDSTQQRNIVSLSGGEDRSGSPLEKLMDINVIKYNIKEPDIQVSKEEEEYLAKLSETDRSAIMEYKQRCREQRINENHYGLSAQELKNIFPDLVIEGQDGKLGINYIELVPILIRSIQELKQELDTRTQVESEFKTRGVAEEGKTEKASVKPNKSVLYQNTPNPFKEQTTIRFSLADDAKDAAICIFDLSGKMLRKMPVTPDMTSVSIGGYELGQGMFLYTLMVNGQEIDTKKMIITK